MKIEIWSDIMCPFCYIGKRHLELALQQFPEMEVELVWKSFQLDPTITPQPGKDVYSYLAERKGMSLEESKQMHQHVVDRAAEVGLV
ncbi:MAG: DsbA family protein, partial [Fluviicola sp.]